MASKASVGRRAAPAVAARTNAAAGERHAPGRLAAGEMHGIWRGANPNPPPLDRFSGRFRKR